MAIAEAHLPEEIIVNILSRLPVKSLIRFSCVSKRLHSIIFSDPKFAISQFEAACDQKTLSRRLLISTDSPQIESVDLETPSFGDESSVRKLNFPVRQPGGSVRLLGSCNGLVIVCLGDEFFYIWNPSIGFFKQLPNPGLSLHEDKFHVYYGFGYVSATDEYKILLASYNRTDRRDEVEIFSLSAQVWKRTQLLDGSYCHGQGILVNESLHWTSAKILKEIVVFDLAAEEVRIMRRPIVDPFLDYVTILGVSFGGCLCVYGHRWPYYDSVDFWVMREYDVRGDSWTKLFTLDLANLRRCCPSDVLVMESCIVAVRSTDNEIRLVGIDHNGEETLGMYKTEGNCRCMIPYEESLLWINV